MKTINKIFILAITLNIVSCSSEKPAIPTFEEKAGQSIANYLSVDSVSNVVILDTILKPRLDTAQSQYDKASAIIDSQLVRLPKLIEATKERINTAQKNLDEASSNLFISGYEDILNAEKKNLASFEETLTRSQKLKDENTVGRAFLNTAYKSLDGDTAYFLVEAKNGDYTQRFAVNTKLKTLHNFSKE